MSPTNSSEAAVQPDTEHVDGVEAIQRGKVVNALPQKSAPKNAPEPKAVGQKFDLSSIRLSQDYVADHGVEKVITNVPIQRSKKGAFFRVHPGQEFQLNAATLELKGDTTEIYLLASKVLGIVPDMEKPVTLRLAVDKAGNPFLIPVPMQSADGRRNSWSDSLAEAVKIAETKWVRISANMSGGSYNVHVATALNDEPRWPTISFGEILEIAFRGRIISTPDHLVIRQLMGLA